MQKVCSPKNLTLSAEGDGYIKVQLPPQPAEGKSLDVQVKQYDFQLDPDIDKPVIDVEYTPLNFHGAETINAPVSLKKFRRLTQCRCSMQTE